MKLLLVFLLVGCTTQHGGAGSAGALSGSRLRARFEHAGSAPRFVGWHDAQLDLDCDFDTYLSNREHRCLPAVAVMGNDYLDAACTQQVATATTPTPTGEYAHFVLQRVDNTCDTAPQLFAASTPSVMATYFLDNGVCAPEVARLAYVPGAPVNKTAFVSAVESHDENGQNWLLAEDGALSPWGGWDGTYAVRPGRANWEPWIVAFNGEGFTDAGCTISSAEKFADSAMCPLEAVQVYDFANNDAISYAELGAPLAKTYKMESDICVAHASDPRLAFSIGSPITKFEPASTEVIGAGQIGVRSAVMRGHSIFSTAFGFFGSPSPDPFVDLPSGLDCVSEPMTDNARHCVPQPTDEAQYFADATCTFVVMPSTSTSPPSMYSYFDNGFVSVRPVVGTLLTAPLYYASNGGCAMGAVGSYYVLGELLPATRFAAVTTTTD